MAALLGLEAPGRSASTVVRLKEVWQRDYDAWSKRSLAQQRFVYLWIDGIHFNVRLDEDRQCVLIVMGATAEGKKKLIAMQDGLRESEQSWRELVLDWNARGLTDPPKLVTGEDARLIVRYDNPDNNYAIEIGKDTGGGSGPIALIKRLRGKESTVSSTTYTTASSVTLKAKVSGSTIKAWVGATLAINTTDGDLSAGGVALAGDTPKFDNVKVGYDNNADDDIDDAGDDLVISDAFDATTVGFTYDDNGNLTDDGTYKYTYDAWNRLVKVTASSDTDIVIQTARFDGLGRRVRKVVTNSGDLDGTTDYYHNRNQIIETRDAEQREAEPAATGKASRTRASGWRGWLTRRSRRRRSRSSGNLVQQMYHGTQYIDELVGLRIADLGRFYVHQDANYNVVALSDMSGRFVERTYYSPYGQPEFALDAHPFDYDDDGDVDATDIAAATTGGDCWGSYTGQGGDCKRLDANADRDITAADHTAIVNYVNTLPSGGELQRTPSSARSRLGNTFAHKGLILDAEIGSYQNRARQYMPRHKKYLQPDPMHLALVSSLHYIDGLNLFLYVQGSPLIVFDPFGLFDTVDVNGNGFEWVNPPPPPPPGRWVDEFIIDMWCFAGGAAFSASGVGTPVAMGIIVFCAATF